MTVQDSAARDHRQSIGLLGLLSLVGLAYVVLIGGTFYGETIPSIQIVSYILVAPVLVYYVWQLGLRGDRIDGLLTLSLLLYATSGIMSSHPRQSFDAVLEVFFLLAALFVARDVLQREAVRSALLRTLMVLSVIVTLAVAYRWFSLTWEWIALSGWLPPPLNMELPGMPWGHRHDAALLAALLYPSWWLGKPGRLRRIVAMAIGIVVVLVVLIDGSRALWAAFAAASLVTGGPAVLRAARSFRPERPTWLLIGMIGAVAAIGVAGAVIDRLSNLSSLGFRFEMWESMLGVFMEHPATGLGPGSFPWMLQITGYFDENFWAPRHADSVPVQLLAEAGLLGAAGLAIALVALVPAVLRGRCPAALWALTAFAVACVAADPANFLFIMVVIVAWIGLSAPHVAHRELRSTERQIPRYLAALGLVVLATAQVATLMASLAFDEARSRIGKAEYAEAATWMGRAVALDPGMALYWRELGGLRLMRSDDDGAASALSTAVGINASDDVAWRMFALARAESGHAEEAVQLVQRAIRVQRSDPANLLLAADLAGRWGRHDQALGWAAEAIQSWPSLAASAEWSAWTVDTGISGTAAIEMAAAAQRAMRAVPQGDATLLAVVANDDSILTRQDPDPLTDLRLESYRCADRPASVLTAAPDGWKRLQGYWEIVLRESARGPAIDERAKRMLEIMRGNVIEAASPTGAVDAVAQRDLPVAIGSDLWGYRRLPIGWPEAFHELPSADAGSATWLLDPNLARANSGLTECSAQSAQDSGLGAVPGD